MAGSSNSNAADTPPPFLTMLSRGQWALICFVLGIVIFGVTIWLWYGQLYNSPQGAFWGMINNSLVTRGVTRTVEDSDTTGTTTQIIRLSFNGGAESRTLGVVTQTDPTNKVNSVTSETLGTADADYIRYTKIQPDDGRFGKVINIWARAGDDKPTQRNNFLLESLFSLVPIANLQPTQRQRLIDEMHALNVYSVDYSKVQTLQQGGRSVYIFPVTLNLQAYITLLNDYLKTIGIPGGSTFDPSQYAGQTAKVTMSVDKLSRQLWSISYDSSSRRENYSNYGVVNLGKPPTGTIAVDELQQRLQGTLQ